LIATPVVGLIPDRRDLRARSVGPVGGNLAVQGPTAIIDLFDKSPVLHECRRLAAVVKQLAVSPRTDGYDQLPLWSDEQRFR
jgi:hypothetical protein